MPEPIRAGDKVANTNQRLQSLAPERPYTALESFGRHVGSMPFGMAKGALNTAANWLDWKPEVGPDTLAPLGMAAFNPLSRVGALKMPEQLAAAAVIDKGLPLPQRLVTAVRINGQVFARGPTHSDAFDEWAKTLPEHLRTAHYIDQRIDRLDEGHVGFVTPDGRFLNRKEAAEYVGSSRGNLESSRGRKEGFVAADTSRSSLPGTVVQGLEQGRLAQRLEAVPQAPRRDVLPSDFSIQRQPVGVRDYEDWFIRDRGANNPFHGLNARVEPSSKVLKISGSELPEGQRGQGHGIAMYQRLIDDAHSRGFVAQSDNRVSPSAQRVYDALADRGYDVARHPKAVEHRSGDLFVPLSNDPVFTVRPPAALADPTLASIMQQYGLAVPQQR